MDNVIRTIRQILTDCDLLDTFNGVHVDYTFENDVAGTLGLFSNGSVKTGETIVGDSKYRITFQLQAGLTAYEDFERLKNSDFLLRLTYWLNVKGKEKIAIQETVDDVVHDGRIEAINAGNALLFDAPSGDINDGVIYQLQFTVDYKIYEE